jgi:hypothetical protein
MIESESFEAQVVARVRAFLARNTPRLGELNSATLTITIRGMGYGRDAPLASASFFESLDPEGLTGRVGGPCVGRAEPDDEVER